MALTAPVTLLLDTTHARAHVLFEVPRQSGASESTTTWRVRVIVRATREREVVVFVMMTRTSVIRHALFTCATCLNEVTCSKEEV